MKKHDGLKTAQMIVFLIFTAACLYLLVLDRDCYHRIAQDPTMQLVCVLLWVSLGLSFLFMLLDFSFSSSVKKDYRELDYAVHSDPLSGLANRFGADTMIEKYLERPIPKDFACVMIELANIRQINEVHGHLVGNAMIRCFSDILNDSSVPGCYIARNGGNKFLAIFEEAEEKDVSNFVSNVERKVKEHNGQAGATELVCRIGVAYHEDPELHLKNVPAMIALANRRMNQ